MFYIEGHEDREGEKSKDCRFEKAEEQIKISFLR